MLAGALLQSRYGKRVQLPLRTYMAELNAYRADFGSEDLYVALQLPASVALYRPDQEIRVVAEDRTLTASHVDWSVEIYHDGLSVDNQSFRLQLEDPDIAFELMDRDIADALFLEVTSFRPGYNTLVVEATSRRVVEELVLPPPTGGPAIVLPILVEVSNDVVGSSRTVYTIHSEFTGVPAILLPAVAPVAHAYVATVADPALSALAYLPAVEIPEASPTRVTVPATLGEPKIRG